MTNATGALTVSVGDKSYRLWLGFSGLAELQAKHGADFVQKFSPPENAPENWLPDLSLVSDLVLEGLQRYHATEADRWLVDDILSSEPTAIEKLFEAAFPDQVKGDAQGN